MNPSYFVAFCLLLQTENLPTVCEKYDEIAVLFVGDRPPEAIFLRKGRVIASRTVREDWRWQATATGFRVIWDDNWQAHRVIDFDGLSVWRAVESDEGFMPWWDQRRLATDLKQPD